MFYKHLFSINYTTTKNMFILNDTHIKILKSESMTKQHAYTYVAHSRLCHEN